VGDILGGALVVMGFLLGIALVTPIRVRYPGRVSDVLAAVAGVMVGVGGLSIVGGANVWSWLVAPLAVGIGAVAQRRALFAPGGPLRT
jgi:uncharacterized membrane protein